MHTARRDTNRTSAAADLRDRWLLAATHDDLHHAAAAAAAAASTAVDRIRRLSDSTQSLQ